MTDLPFPRPRPLVREPFRAEVDGVSLALFDVGLACCALEFQAALGVGGVGLSSAGVPAGVNGAGVPAGVNVLIVSGTVTDVLADAVVAEYEALPHPKRVVSFGACANTGGPYWDSYSVLKGIDQRIPVDLYVHGCPPRPEVVSEALRTLVSGFDRGGETGASAGETGASGSETGA